MAQALLQNRGIIRVSGEDARHFLQGIVTNDVFAVTPENAVYACFLTPQGKYLADFFVYEVDGDLLLDVGQELLPDFLRRLTMYKLRSKVTVTDASAEFSIGAVWSAEKPQGDLVFKDPRFKNAGYRILNADFSGNDNYTLWQMQNGLPDVADFERERTTMLEANMDFLHAISWTKGCYMGQELTARTHYRGLTKKRFLPVRLSAVTEISAETPLLQNGKTIGYLRRTIGDHALASVQLEALQNGHQCQVNGIDAEIMVPEWFDLATVITQP